MSEFGSELDRGLTTAQELVPGGARGITSAARCTPQAYDGAKRASTFCEGLEADLRMRGAEAGLRAYGFIRLSLRLDDGKRAASYPTLAKKRTVLL